MSFWTSGMPIKLRLFWSFHATGTRDLLLPLIHPIAEWAEIAPLELYPSVKMVLADVACAGAKGPIEFINSPEEVSYTPVDFKPSFLPTSCFLCTWARNRAAMMASRLISKAVKDKKKPEQRHFRYHRKCAGQGPQRFQKN